MLGRRIIATMSGLAFLSASTGISAPDFSRKSDEDYLCRYHVCGCLNAEMCRRHCCCFKKRYTWSSRRDSVTRKSRKVSRSCCARKRDGTSSLATKEQTGVAGGASQSGHRFHVALLTPLGCKGITTYWVSLGLVTPLSALITLWSPRLPSQCSVFHSGLLLSLADVEPPTPPPRV